MLSDSIIKIFVAYHKEAPIIQSDCLIPIQVGRASSQNKLNMIGDDKGDNISHKNQYYCELTAQYWMWKNVSADYYGLFHYRRFFNFKKSKIEFFSDFSTETCARFGWTDLEIKRYCKKYDAITAPVLNVHPPGNSKIIISPYELYRLSHSIADLDSTIEIIKNRYPEYYSHAQRYLFGKKSCYFNMFILKRDLFQDYSEWLFSILFELEKRIIISDNQYQSRVFGFIGERLFNIYFLKLREEGKCKINEIHSIVTHSNNNNFRPKYSLSNVKMLISNILK